MLTERMSNTTPLYSPCTNSTRHTLVRLFKICRVHRERQCMAMPERPKRLKQRAVLSAMVVMVCGCPQVTQVSIRLGSVHICVLDRCMRTRKCAGIAARGFPSAVAGPWVWRAGETCRGQSALKGCGTLVLPAAYGTCATGFAPRIGFAVGRAAIFHSRNTHDAHHLAHL